MIEWLPAVALYWTLAALYLGGAAIDIEGGGAGRQIAGILLHFVAFIVVFGLAKFLLQGMAGLALGVALGLVVAAILLPITAKLTFRLVGVRITSSSVAAGEASG